MDKKSNLPKNSIRRFRRRIPLDIRLYVQFQTEWFDLFVPHNRPHTEKEGNKADKWARKMAERVIKLHKEYVKDLL